MGYCKFLSLLILSILFKLTYSQKDSIDMYIDSAFKYDNYYGVSAVFEKDSLVYYKSIGYEDRNNNTLLSETLFLI